MPDIFTYTDFRAFIQDWYKEENQVRPGITYRKIADAVGFTSPAHLTMVLQKKTKLGAEHCRKFSLLMGLNKKETACFIQLVNYNQAKSTEDKKRFFDGLVKLNSSGTTLLSPDQYEYYQKWYYSAVYDILSFYDFKGDYRALARMVEPSITPREAEKAVKLLERLQFIAKKPDNGYACNIGAISAYTEGKSLALSTYAKEMINRAGAVVDDVEKDDRAISWAGFSMSKETFEKIKLETREFRKRIIAMANADTSPSRAYHINIQLFPVSKTAGPSEEKP
jgi:uncharacterized protein (TIGR02147 family)